LLCEMMDELSMEASDLEKDQLSTLLDYYIPRAFLFRLRNISFLLATALTVSLLTMSTLDPFETFSTKPLKQELTGALIECGRWYLMLFMVISMIKYLIVANVESPSLGVSNYEYLRRNGLG